MSCFANQVDD
jgi:hypothetical protein